MFLTLLIVVMFVLWTVAWPLGLYGLSAIYCRGGEFQPQIGLLHNWERPQGRRSWEQGGALCL